MRDHSWIMGQREAFATHGLQLFPDTDTVEVAHASWLWFMASSDLRARIWMSGDQNRCATGNRPTETAKQPFIERQRYHRKGAITDDRKSLPQSVSGKRITGSRFPWRDLQPGRALPEMLADLPQRCAVGTKQNSKGHRFSGIGYKMHIDAADGGIPVSCILTPASTSDGQVSIPLTVMKAQRVFILHDLMHSACAAPEIREYTTQLGYTPIIAENTHSPGRKQEMQAEAAAGKAAGGTLPQGTAVRPAYHRRSREQPPERPVRRPQPAGAGTWQGGLPTDVRHRGVHSRPIDAPAFLTPPAPRHPNAGKAPPRRGEGPVGAKRKARAQKIFRNTRSERTRNTTHVLPNSSKDMDREDGCGYSAAPTAAACGPQ